MNTPVATKTVGDYAYVLTKQGLRTRCNAKCYRIEGYGANRLLYETKQRLDPQLRFNPTSIHSIHGILYVVVNTVGDHRYFVVALKDIEL